jgi:hypothetical protein
MTRGRSRKTHQSSRKSTDENDHSQTGQGEEIAPPPAQSTNPRRGRPEELTEMNRSNPLQTEPEIETDYYYAASAVSPNAHHQYTEAPLFSIDHVAEPLPNAAQTLEDQHCEEPESQQPHLVCLTQARHREICVFARQLEVYSNEAHLSTDMAAIQCSETLPDANPQHQDDFPPDFEVEYDDSYSTLQNPTKAPIISFLEHFLSVQSSTGRLKCAIDLDCVFGHVQFIPNHRGKNMRYQFMMIMDAGELQ